MNELDKLRTEHLNARIAKHTISSNVLGTLLGEVENTIKNNKHIDPSVVVKDTAKKIHKILETIGTEQAQIEMEVLYPFLPQTMSQDEIKVELDKLGLESMSNFGRKMGAAMSALKGKADGNDVKAVLQANYLT